MRSARLCVAGAASRARQIVAVAPPRLAGRTSLQRAVPGLRGAAIGRALLIVTLAALVGASEPTTDAGQRVELSATPAQAKATKVDVGDAVVVALTYVWPRGWTATPEPDPGRDFAELFVTAFPPPEVVRTAEREERRYRLTVLAPTSGAWALPRPAFTVHDAQGVAHAAQAPEVILQVGTDAAPAKVAAPRPLWSRPESVAHGQSRRALVAEALVVAALVAAVLVLALRRRRAAPGATPAQRFAAELDAARVAGDGKEVGARLSVALRRYAGATWRFDGVGSTAREVAAQLRARAPEGEARIVARLLDELDALRWSADQLPPSQVAPLLEHARTWVDAVERRRDEEARAAAQAKRGAAPAGAPS